MGIDIRWGSNNGGKFLPDAYLAGLSLAPICVPDSPQFSDARWWKERRQKPAIQLPLLWMLHYITVGTQT